MPEIKQISRFIIELEDGVQFIAMPSEYARQIFHGVGHTEEQDEWIARCDKAIEAGLQLLTQIDSMHNVGETTSSQLQFRETPGGKVQRWKIEVTLEK